VRGTPIEFATIDYHTAGEPFRIVLEGVPEIPGASVAERRERAAADEQVDFARRLLCHEPRGHADMYGCFLVPPDDDDADLGVLFWHKDGYSTACGHGTIALGAWAVESGRVIAAPDGETEVTIDVPSGRVLARARLRDARVESVSFRNVPSYVLARGVSLDTSRGRLAVDVAYGGAIYASLDARTAGLAIEAGALTKLISLGREVKRLLDGGEHSQHPSDPRLSGIYGTIIFEDLGDGEDGPHQRNATVFADGEVDRSPCGSGTSARLALLAAEGRIDASRVLRHGSITGTEFLGRITETVEADGREALVTEIEGSAFRTGEHRFSLDPRDPLATGFVLR
jgi:proline racemase/trans-L-3-hydroxyproline dehydratase